MEVSKSRQEEMEEKEKEALHVFKQDLSKWLNTVLDADITPPTFLSRLDTGVLLCQLAKEVQDKARNKEGTDVSVPMKEIHCNKEAKKGSFQARDNTANFISWCRELGIDESIIFESEGLVLHRDERRVILTLLGVARVGSRLGMAVPKLVELEKEIEKLEERGTEGGKTDDEVKSEGPPDAKRRRKKENLDEKVLSILHDCTCKRKLRATSHGCGKFHMTTPSGRSMTIYIRVVQDRVMVRVGGGWDTLEHLLLKYDPCRTKISDTLSMLTASIAKSLATPTFPKSRPITSKARQPSSPCSVAMATTTPTTGMSTRKRKVTTSSHQRK